MCVMCLLRRALLLLPVSNLKEMILLPSHHENKSVTSNILHRDTPTIFQHTEEERETATVWLDTIHSVSPLADLWCAHAS